MTAKRVMVNYYSVIASASTLDAISSASTAATGGTDVPAVTADQLASALRDAQPIYDSDRLDELHRHLLAERDAMRGALRTLRQWDMLDTCADGKWAKLLIDVAIGECPDACV